jgi:hypothetical protein
MRAVLVAVAALSVVSCVKVDPVRKSQLDTWRAGLSAKAVSYPSASGGRTTIAEGQWVELLFLDENDDPTKIRYSVLGEEADGRWIEVDRTDYYGRNIAKILIVATDWNNPGGWTIKRMITQSNSDKPVEVPAPAIGLMGDKQLGALKTQLKTEGAARETVTVPAGIFTDCLRIRSTTETTLGRFESTMWLHNAVPITGWARAKSKDAKYSMEVTSFGWSGATDAITQ